MHEYVTIQEQIERRTYLKGKFRGKFIGFLDYRKSDIKHENFYDLEVLSGEIFTEKSNLRSWKDGDEFEEYLHVEKFLTELPEIIPTSISYADGSVKHFQINLHEPKLTNYTLSNQHYDGNKIFGDIVGEISGYIKHYDIKEHEVEVVPTEEGGQEMETPPKIKTTKKTGKSETNGDYIRWEYYYSDGSTFWGDWIFYKIRKWFSSLFNNFLGVLGWLYIIFLIISFFSIFFNDHHKSSYNNNNKSSHKKYYSPDDGNKVNKKRIKTFVYPTPLPVTVPTPIPSPINVPEPAPFLQDSIISHFRHWTDYDSNSYSGYLRIKLTDFNSSKKFHNELDYNIDNVSKYNYLVSKIHDFDNNKLLMVYHFFDSIKVNNNLNKIQFAEMIMSCIQDIPYTLVLNNACNPKEYNDNFIRNYLNLGGKCEGYVKFGLFTPVEFMGTLEGDCDTRTILLFTILNHYNYDVAILGSELYKHSVIGINLPFNGIGKVINHKRYVIWETTAAGIKPGYFPRELSDMNFWNINLLSKN